MSSDVQNALTKANSALQIEQYKGTVTGVKLNGTTKSPSNGVVDLGNVATTEYTNTNFVKKLGQDEEITINNSCNNGDCKTNLSLKCVSDDSKFKLESWHQGEFSKISGDCRGSLDFTAATRVGDEYELVTSTLSLRHDSLKWNDKQLATEEYVDSKLGSVETLVLITHSELKTLRDNSQLIPGTFYRITDYECTTTQADSQSVNHPFDIIVQALDESTLSENAQAIQHEGDEYFANAKLEAWQLKYTLDNDASRFAWAKELIIEQPARWSCGWGVLEERYDDGASANYTTATIDGVQKYLYRPSQPTSYLKGKTFYRYEGREMMSFEDASELYFVTRENPFEVGEQTSPMLVIYAPTGYVIAELEVTSDYGENRDYEDNAIWDTYFGDALEMKTYGDTIEINGVTYYGWDHYEDDSQLHTWAYDNSPFVISEGTKIVYNGSTDSLYYAFDGVIDKFGGNVYEVTDGNHIYKYEDEVYGEDALLDTISYTNYIAPREGGKGVIYRLIDEHNNDCPFDFKNMQFLHNGEWYYTFSCFGEDATLGDKCFDNYLELVQDQLNSSSTDTVLLPATMPMLIFNLIYNKSGYLDRGIIKNNVRTPIKKGFIQGYRIDGNTWMPTTGGRLGDLSKFYIYSTGQVYANIFQGHAKNFTAGTIDNPNVNFYANVFKLAIIANNSVTIDCNRFAANTLDIHNGGIQSKKIKGGDFLNCYFDDYGAAKEAGNVDLVFEANLAIANSYFRIFDALTINYENTTSSTTPLRFLNIDARGWDRGISITIPSTFPVNAGYELKVAKNSKGEIKMWCDADLIA